MKLALAQMQMSEDIDENLKKSIDCANDKAQVIDLEFPNLYNSFQKHKHQETMDMDDHVQL